MHDTHSDWHMRRVRNPWQSSCMPPADAKYLFDFPSMGRRDVARVTPGTLHVQQVVREFDRCSCEHPVPAGAVDRYHLHSHNKPADCIEELHLIGPGP